MRLSCLVILAVMLVVPPAWSQRVPTEEELDEAIQTVKATIDSKQTGVKNFKTRLTQARRLLAGNPAQSLSRVTALLDDGTEQIRLNAAIILADAAQRSGSIDPALMNALKRCLDDQSAAVAYWGLQGFMADSVPVEKQVEAIEASLNIKTPRLVRLAAARLAGDKRLHAAIPALVAHLQRILPSYTFQVNTILTYEVQVDEEGNPLNPEMEDPGYTGKSRLGDATRTGKPVESPLLGEGRGAGVNVGGPTRRGPARGGLGPGAVGPGPGGPGVGGPGIGGPSRRPRPTPAPGARRRVLMGDREDEDIIVEKRLIDPDRLSIQEVNMLILDLQELPSVYELHEIGYITEILARGGNPRDMPFGEEASFERAPPWALARCVEAAVAWLDKNRAEFPNATVPAPAPATDTGDSGDNAGDTAAENGNETAAAAEEAPET